MDEKLKRICRNYNAIINCEFMDDDIFSQSLVNCYKDVISQTNVDDVDALSKLAKFDHVVRKYIEDYDFSKKVQEFIDVRELTEYKGNISIPLLEYVTQYSDIYDNEKNDIVTNTKWI